MGNSSFNGVVVFLMNDFEFQARAVLADDFAVRARAAYSDPETVLAIRRKAEDATLSTIDKIVRSETHTPSDVLRFKNKMLQMISQYCTQEKGADEASELWMRGRAHYEGDCEMYFGLLQEKGIELSQEMLSHRASLLNAVHRRDKIVANLASDLEKRGFEYAFRDENLHAAVRREYKTADEYVAETKKLLESQAGVLSALFHLSDDSTTQKVMYTFLKQMVPIYMGHILETDTKAIWGEESHL
jgi:hypothetical protein